MTELTASFSMCRAGRFHIPPWIISYVFDPASGALLPREGRQKGRSGFMDLLPQSYWGGVISADAVEIGWDACACGRTSAHMAPAIQRITSGGDGDVLIGPATESAISTALDALLDGLPRPH